MKINKFIFSLVCGCIFLFSAFTLSSCSLNCGGGNSTNSTEQNQPNANNNTNSNSNNSNNNDNSNNSNNNSDNSNNNNNNNQGGNNEDENLDAKYSRIAQKLFTDPYYCNMVNEMANTSNAIAPKHKPMPYKFLREHNHNVDAYLNGTLNAFASSYIYDNDKNHIYVSVKAENVSSSQYGNYYTNYVLKYPLTDQEYNEYTFLCRSEYLQGLLYIQELDNQKTPDIVNQINVAKKTYNIMIEEYPGLTLNVDNYSKMEIDIYEADMESAYISIRESIIATYKKSTIYFAKLNYKLLTHPLTYDDNVVYITSPSSISFNKNEIDSSMEKITSFSYGYTIDNINAYPEYIK